MPSNIQGYLVQTATTDSDLGEFFHDMLFGLSGIDTDLIRVNWQPNPPVSPENGVDWIAFGITISNTEDGGAYLESTDGITSNLIRHEQIELALQIYGDNGLLTAGVVRDGLEIGQNREALYLNKMAYVGASATLNVPELINGIWFKRCDAVLTFRREVSRTFEVLGLVDIQGTIEPDPEELGTRTIDSIIP